MPKKLPELSAFHVRKLAGKPGRHFVGGVAGLHLYVQGPKSRSWILRLSVGGRRPDMGLGGFPDVSLEMARERARAAREQLWNGVNPLAARMEAKAEAVAEERKKTDETKEREGQTFAQIAATVCEIKAQGFKGGADSKHAAQWGSTLTEYAFPVIGEKWVGDVTKADVLKILEPIWFKKTDTASRLRGRIEKVMAYAQAKNIIAGVNVAAWSGFVELLPSPSKLMKRKKKHFAALPWRRMAEFMELLKADKGVGPRCLEWAILTAARNNEARAARYSQIDRKEKVWTCPPEMMKGGLQHRVPLSATALRVLDSAQRRRGCKHAECTHLEACDYVFTYGGEMMSENALREVVLRIVAKMDGKPKARDIPTNRPPSM